MCSTLSQLPPAGFQCLKNETICVENTFVDTDQRSKKNYKWGTLYCRVSGSILLCHRLGRTCSRIGYDGEKENGRGDWSAKPQNVFSFYGFSVMLLAFSLFLVRWERTVQNTVPSSNNPRLTWMTQASFQCRFSELLSISWSGSEKSLKFELLSDLRFYT